MNANNVTRFTARTAREAMNLVKKAFGDDAVVLSTKPSASGGVEMLAMGPEGVSHIEKTSMSAPVVRAPVVKEAKPAAVSTSAAEVGRDVEQLAMSTLSFQDYVRERMLKRRQAQRDLAAMEEPTVAPSPNPAVAEAAVVGAADATTGQAIIAYVILRGGEDVDAEVLRAHVADEIGAIAKPKQIYITPDLPKTRSGKIMRRLLRDVAEGRNIGDTTTLADASIVDELQARAATAADD
mgnify:CR=1 FL=1